jgi:hypothetical protein
MIFSRANIVTFSTSVAIQGCGLITGILTARLLGPTARGEFATVMLWPMILSNLGLLGFNWALAREVGMDGGREADWVCAAVLSGFAASLLFLAIGFFLVPYLLPSDRQYLVSLTRACLLLIPLDVVNQILLAVDHGRMRWRRYNFMRASFFIFYAILICAIWAERKTTSDRGSHSSGDASRIVPHREIAAFGMRSLVAIRDSLFLGDGQQFADASTGQGPRRRTHEHAGCRNLCCGCGVWKRAVFARGGSGHHVFCGSFQ